jgi:long-chain acyl-CoA synthetase
MITLTDLVARARAIAGDRTAVICGDTIFTWAEVDARIQRLAGVLRGLGLACGDRVAMLGGNSAGYFDFYFAVPAAGGIAVPINTRLAPPEIAELLLDSGARILIVEPQFLEIISGIRSDLPQVEYFVVAGPHAPAGFKCLEALPSVEPGPTDSGGNIDDVAMLLYTGGTTGRSKGVMLTHRALLTNTLQWAAGLDFSPDEKLLIGAPMFHTIAATNCVAAAVFGVSTCILPRFDPILFFETVQRRRPNSTTLVPTMIEMLVTHPDIGRYDLSSLRKFVYGGSPMPVRTLTRALEALPGARFYQGYGQTETGPVTILRPEHHTGDGSKLLSAGQPVPLTLISIHDSVGRRLPPGETGEICARSPSIAPGYWQLPELSAETQRGGWHHTGDAGYLDEDGFLFVVDRVKDMIVTGGENVYAAEVENVLQTHPAVAGCAVIGIPHARLVEQVHAIVRVNAGAKVEAHELIAHCRKSLAGYKCPRSVEFRDEPFPVNGAGKIIKRELRREYAERNS